MNLKKLALTTIFVFLFFVSSASAAHAAPWATGSQSNNGKSWAMLVCASSAADAGTYQVQYAAFWCGTANNNYCPFAPDGDFLGQLYQVNTTVIVPFDTSPSPPPGSNCAPAYSFSITPAEPPYPCGRIQTDVIMSTDGGSTYTQNLGGGNYNTGTSCPAATATPTLTNTPTPVPNTPTPLPNAPTMSLFINAGGNAVAQGTYGNTGLRADEPNNPPGANHGSNYYNSIDINPQFSGKSQTDTGLVGFAFTNKTGAASGTGIGNLKSLTSGVNGFLAVYTYCGSSNPCAATSDGQPAFEGRKMYVYYNGSWRGPFDPGIQQNIAGANAIFVNLVITDEDSPVFNVQLLKNSGNQQWATYTFFKQNDGSGASGEFFERKPACNSIGTCTSSFLPLELQRKLYAFNARSVWTGLN